MTQADKNSSEVNRYILQYVYKQSQCLQSSNNAHNATVAACLMYTILSNQIIHQHVNQLASRPTF
jgi:hypothetical protein